MIPETLPDEHLRPFGPEHLAYLMDENIIDRTYTLGPLVQYLDENSVNRTVAELQHWNILDAGYALTEPGRDILSGLTSFTEAIWGVLLIHNEQQPFTLDLDEELIDYGLHLSLMDTPKVYWHISARQGKLTTAVRAGDTVSIDVTPIEHSPRAAMADSLITAIDPERQWKPANIDTMIVAQEIIVAAGGVGRYGEDEKQNRSADQKLRKSLIDNKMSPAAADNFIALQRADHVAITDIAHSFSPDDICAPSASISFVRDKGMVVTYPQQGLDRTVQIVQEPASVSKVTAAIERLSRLPHRRRQGLEDISI